MSHIPVCTITDQSMAEPLLGRPTLELDGLDTKEVTAAAAYCLHGAIEICIALSEMGHGGRLFRVYRDAEFHRDQGLDGSFEDTKCIKNVRLQKANILIFQLASKNYD